jgi:molybdopterin molybdotransferase
MAAPEVTPAAKRAPMLSLDEALARLVAGAAAARIAEVESVAAADAFGRVLAADLVSAIDVPPLDNSAMDGYALRASDAGAGAVLPVSQRIAAGHAGTALAPGSAARIFTGAPLPAGAVRS